MKKMFIPKRIIFEKNSLNYELGQTIYSKFNNDSSIEIIRLTSNRIKENIPNENFYKFFRESKNTLVVGVKKGLKFQSCKPSAHYQLPLISGCMGYCQYCYLNTNLGDKPYVKINVNLDDIFNQAKVYMDERSPEITIFEGAATSDPLPLEPYTNILKKTIEFFSTTANGRFRFVTKYDNVDNLLNIKHNGNTEIRFTLNTSKVIKEYENRTCQIDKRIEASIKIAKANYPIGFIIAPVFLYENWKEDYRNLLIDLSSKLPNDLNSNINFEIISHRYTTRAKNIIIEAFPSNTLPMDDSERTYKYGQFGYGKFVYTKENLKEIKTFFTSEINALFKNSIIKYII